jgi:hypothetical protein
LYHRSSPLPQTVCCRCESVWGGRGRGGWGWGGGSGGGLGWGLGLGLGLGLGEAAGRRLGREQKLVRKVAEVVRRLAEPGQGQVRVWLRVRLW